MTLQKYKRPQKLPSTTVKVKVGCGTLYVTVSRDDGRIVEVFATIGKAGQCALAQNEALMRSITSGLKYGVPIDEYISQLKGIRCPAPYMLGTDQEALSCPDAIAKVLEAESTS